MLEREFPLDLLFLMSRSLWQVSLHHGLHVVVFGKFFVFFLHNNENEKHFSGGFCWLLQISSSFGNSGLGGHFAFAFALLLSGSSSSHQASPLQTTNSAVEAAREASCKGVC